jgi:DNA gyrase/topoisomerase IV subunit B
MFLFSAKYGDIRKMNFGIVDYFVAVILVIVGVLVKLKGDTDGSRIKIRERDIQKYLEELKNRNENLQNSSIREADKDKTSEIALLLNEIERQNKEILNIWNELNTHKRITNKELLSLTKILYEIKGFLNAEE